MWKKEDADPMVPRSETAPGAERVAPKKTPGERATIGRSITITGEVKGDEDLLIQGRVDGSVTLKQHAVTVGAEGEVKADIGARVITVEGTVEGNLNAQEQVVLRGSALVHGNITAPRLVLEDGARFRGGVDMGEAGAESATIPKAAAGTAWSSPPSGRVSSESKLSAAADRETSGAAAAKDAGSPTATPVSR